MHLLQLDERNLPLTVAECETRQRGSESTCGEEGQRPHCNQASELQQPQVRHALQTARQLLGGRVESADAPQGEAGQLHA